MKKFSYTIFIRLTARPGRLLNFWTLTVGGYLIEVGADSRLGAY